jgi:4-hydroxy-tetrahydrodipicolinate synthase
MLSFKGLSAFPITPMDAQGRVDADLLRGLLTRLVEAGVSSIGLLGSTGSYPYLSRAERRRAIEIAVAHVDNVPILASVGALRTDEAMALAQDARAAGAAAGLLAPVSYTPLTDDEVFAHFASVAAATDMPICIYNNPGTTHFSFSPALISRLSALPTIAAVKNPASPAETIAAEFAAVKAQVQPGFSIGYSGDWNATEALLAGGECWYSVVGGLFPEPCLAIIRAVEVGDAAEARRLNAQLQPLWGLFQKHTSLRVVYAASRILGLNRMDPPRPILPLSDAVMAEIATALEQLGLR